MRLTVPDAPGRQAVCRQPSAVGQLNRLAFRELAPHWSFGNAGGFGLLDVKAPAPHVLLQDVAERRTATVLGGKGADVVAVALPHDVAGLHLVDLDRKRDALDTQLHRGAEDLLGPFGSVQEQRLRPALQAERPDQADDAEKMIGVKMGKEDFAQREAHAVAHHLALGAFAALEQERLALAVNGEATDVPFDCWPGGGGAEEGDG